MRQVIWGEHVWQKGEVIGSKAMEKHIWQEKESGNNMAINIKQIVADAMLDLCRTKELKAITIKDIREKTWVSRQGFYNHFKDKDDLIHWIYYDRVLTNFHIQTRKRIL